MVVKYLGGYDPRVTENVEHLQELELLAHSLKLNTHLWTSDKKVPKEAQVIFLPSFTDAQRTFLLRTSECLVYTPSNEHFGIVPLEAMYNSLPVLAVNSGGPLETVIDGVTGYLCPPTVQDFSTALTKLVRNVQKNEMGSQGRVHVSSKFSMDKFSSELEHVVFKTEASKNVAALFTYYGFVVMWFSLFPLLLIYMLTE